MASKDITAATPANDSAGHPVDTAPRGQPADSKQQQPSLHKRQINTAFGKVIVHIQGDLSEKDKRPIFVTVHDIGSNHSAFKDFVEQPCMCEVKARSIFIHIDLPGQEDAAADLPDDIPFPSVQQMGEQIISTVLDQLDFTSRNCIIGIGEGAGSNILVRFALGHTSRVLGLILIHLVTAGVGMLEKLKDTFISGKRRPSEAFQSPDQVIAMHRLGMTASATAGSPVSPTTNADITAATAILSDSYQRRVASLNPKNLRKYVEAYMNRKDISPQLTQIKSLDVLLVAGSKSPYLAGVVHLYGKMEKGKSSFLKIDNVVDPLSEAPEKLAQSLLLFVKGLGYLTSLQQPGIERARTLSGSSGEASSASASHNLTVASGAGNLGRRRTLQMEVNKTSHSVD